MCEEGEGGIAAWMDGRYFSWLPLPGSFFVLVDAAGLRQSEFEWLWQPTKSPIIRFIETFLCLPFWHRMSISGKGGDGDELKLCPSSLEPTAHMKNFDLRFDPINPMQLQTQLQNHTNPAPKIGLGN